MVLNRKMMIGVAAVAGLGVMVYLMRSKGTATAATVAGSSGSSGSSSANSLLGSLASILGSVGSATTSTVAGLGSGSGIQDAYASSPLHVTDAVAVNKPTVNVALAPPPADAGGFSVGGGGGGQGNKVAAGLDASSYGPTFAPGGGMISFGASNTLKGKALLMNNYGWTQQQYDSWASNPLNASLVPTD